MSALKEKQKQEKELLSSQANMMVADFLIDLDNLRNTGYISDYEFKTIKNDIFNCNINIRGASIRYIQNDLKNWIMFLKIGLINNYTFCNEISSILTYDIFDERKFPVLLSDDAPIKSIIIGFYNSGCTIENKLISKNEQVVVMTKKPYIVTIRRYRSFFFRDWKSKIIFTDNYGTNYKYTILTMYKVLDNA